MQAMDWLLWLASVKYCDVIGLMHIEKMYMRIVHQSVDGDSPNQCCTCGTQTIISLSWGVHWKDRKRSQLIFIRAGWYFTIKKWQKEKHWQLLLFENLFLLYSYMAKEQFFFFLPTSRIKALSALPALKTLTDLPKCKTKHSLRALCKKDVWHKSNKMQETQFVRLIKRQDLNVKSVQTSIALFRCLRVAQPPTNLDLRRAAAATTEKRRVALNENPPPLPPSPATEA